MKEGCKKGRKAGTGGEKENKDEVEDKTEVESWKQREEGQRE